MKKVWAPAFVLLQWDPPMRGVPPCRPACLFQRAPASFPHLHAACSSFPPSCVSRFRAPPSAVEGLYPGSPPCQGGEASAAWPAP
jgi:hypothetical protein